jgi:hypothetical protein
MKKQLEDYIYHKKNFLSKTYCEDVIQEIDNATWKEHEWYNVKDDYFFSKSQGPKALKDSYGYTDLTEPVADIANNITDDLHPVIQEYINYFNFDWLVGWEGYTGIKLFKYEINTEMELHWDNVRDIFDGERKGIPIFSIVGVLNDNYSGGEFLMFGDTKIEMNQGDVILFPSTFTYPHKVTPITEGVRYSYVSWGW